MKKLTKRQWIEIIAVMPMTVILVFMVAGLPFAFLRELMDDAPFDGEVLSAFTGFLLFAVCLMALIGLWYTILIPPERWLERKRLTLALAFVGLIWVIVGGIAIFVVMTEINPGTVVDIILAVLFLYLPPFAFGFSKLAILVRLLRNEKRANKISVQ